MDIIYRLKSPTDLADLNDSFNISPSKGLYFDIGKLVLRQNDNPEKFNQTIKYLKAVKSLKKNILITFDYNSHFKRPIYFSPKIKEEQILKLKSKVQKGEITREDFNEKIEQFDQYLQDNEKMIENLKELAELPNLKQDFVSLKEKVITCQKILTEKRSITEFFENHHQIQIIGWEVPHIANFPEIEKSDPYFVEIQVLINRINQMLVELAIKEKKIAMIYPITLMLEDITNKTPLFFLHIENVKKFKMVIIWAINSNEIYQSKKNKKSFFSFVQKINSNNHLLVFVKYYGIKQVHEFKKKIDNVNIVFREDAYSSYNINIPRHANPFRTRDLLDINKIKHLNEKDISKIEDDTKEFCCNCSICLKYDIKNYSDANHLYFSTKITKDPNFVEKFLPKREVLDLEKYKLTKARRFQAKNRKIHNFECLDQIIFMNSNDFKKKYPKIVLNW